MIQIQTSLQLQQLRSTANILLTELRNMNSGIWIPEYLGVKPTNPFLQQEQKKIYDELNMLGN